MTFNGLKGSQLAAYNYLLQADLTRPVSINEIAATTCYEYTTIWKAIKDLEDMNLITRRRQTQWQPYHFQVME